MPAAAIVRIALYVVKWTSEDSNLLVLAKRSRHESGSPRGIEQQTFDGDTLARGQRTGPRIVHHGHFREHHNVDVRNRRCRPGEERRQSSQRECTVTHAGAPHLTGDLRGPQTHEGRRDSSGPSAPLDQARPHFPLPTHYHFPT